MENHAHNEMLLGSNALFVISGLPVLIEALFCRRRHQPRRPALAKIRPGRPAPAMGAGTLTPLLATA
jgi:hypothetical protein